MKNKYGSLETLMQGKGKTVSRLFFHTFTTEENVTRILHPDTWKKQQKPYKHIHYVDRNIHRLCKKWSKDGFLEKSKPRQIIITNRWGNKQEGVVYWKILNLNPFYKFFEMKGIPLTDTEKEFLKFFILSEYYRYQILKEFPDDDIINAILKFYVKNCILRYLNLLRDKEENPKKYKTLMKKVKDLNRPDRPPLSFLEPDKNRYPRFTPIGILANDKVQKHQRKMYKQYSAEISQEIAQKYPDEYWIDRLFYDYMIGISISQKTIESVDKKILQALNLMHLS